MNEHVSVTTLWSMYGSYSCSFMRMDIRGLSICSEGIYEEEAIENDNVIATNLEFSEHSISHENKW